ncbi:MAG: hypothetical protein V1782_00575 [Pseudomonadota bacterium]
MPEKSLAVFEGKRIRRHYDEDADTWYFLIVDLRASLALCCVDLIIKRGLSPIVSPGCLGGQK